MVGKEEKKILRYSDGSIKTQEVFRIVVYVGSPNLEIVDEVARAIYAFVELVSIGALDEYYDDEGQQEDLTEDSLRQLIDDRLLGPNRSANAHIELMGGDAFSPEYFLSYRGSSLMNPDNNEEVCFLYFSVPVEFYENSKDALLGFLDDVVSMMPVTFAYASLGLAGRNQKAKQALAARYPGLDIADPGSVSFDLGTRAAGAYWLVVLGPELCRMLNGVSGVEAAVSSFASVTGMPGEKCKITLGSDPALGDHNRREVLADYQALAHFFDQNNVLHRPSMSVYFEDNDGAPDHDAMMQWHERFLM